MFCMAYYSHSPFEYPLRCALQRNTTIAQFLPAYDSAQAKEIDLTDRSAIEVRVG